MTNIQNFEDRTLFLLDFKIIEYSFNKIFRSYEILID
jgi:hypothetical protein